MVSIKSCAQCPKGRRNLLHFSQWLDIQKNLIIHFIEGFSLDLNRNKFIKALSQVNIWKMLGFMLFAYLGLWKELAVAECEESWRTFFNITKTDHEGQNLKSFFLTMENLWLMKSYEFQKRDHEWGFGGLCFGLAVDLVSPSTFFSWNLWNFYFSFDLFSSFLYKHLGDFLLVESGPLLVR